jgi:hypothetical protein
MSLFGKSRTPARQACRLEVFDIGEILAMGAMIFPSLQAEIS